ncbi:hypothetical protein BC828DRAFT_377598, partial [Blastocladiella britannica]
MKLRRWDRPQSSPLASRWSKFALGRIERISADEPDSRRILFRVAVPHYADTLSASTWILCGTKLAGYGNAFLASEMSAFGCRLLAPQPVQERPRHVIQWWEHKVQTGAVSPKVFDIVPAGATQWVTKLDLPLIEPREGAEPAALDWWWSHRDRFDLKLPVSAEIGWGMVEDGDTDTLAWYLDTSVAGDRVPSPTMYAQVLIGALSHGQFDMIDRLLKVAGHRSSTPTGPRTRFSCRASAGQCPCWWSGITCGITCGTSSPTGPTARSGRGTRHHFHLVVFN